jgi:hypothetical protein
MAEFLHRTMKKKKKQQFFVVDRKKGGEVSLVLIRSHRTKRVRVHFIL